MSLVGEVGDGVLTSGEVTFEWKISDIFALSDKVDDWYTSPSFSFADSRWDLMLYPNGETKNSSEGWVSLYLIRGDSGPLKTLYYNLRIKGSDGTEAKKEIEYNFPKKNEGRGYPKFWLRSKLQNQVSRLMPDKVLTIVCHLKCSVPNVVKASWSNRVCKVSSNMKKILAEGKRADFTLKLGDREWFVHKVILESRCEYFANMFRHEWVENTVGEVTFDDVEEDALDCVLDFVYSGVVEDMSVKNVCEIYVAAHKFLLDDLKALCIEYMRGNLSVEIVCKVLVIADIYEEGELKESAIEYFSQETSKIFDSEEWKEFKKDHLSIVAEVLEESAKREIKKRSK